MESKKFLFLILLITVISCGFIFGNDSRPKTYKSNPHVDFVTIAHRGVPILHPEHTIASYEEAIQLGADYIEIDVQMTEDGVLVAIHDATVNRTTDGTGKVGDFAFSELISLDTLTNTKVKVEDRYHSIPSLEQIFVHFGKSTHYYIELKNPELYPGMEEQLISLLEKYQLLDSIETDSIPRVIIQSFSKSSLQKVHEIDPTIPLLQLYKNHNYPQFNNEKLKELKTYAYGVGLPVRSLKIKDIEILNVAHLKVHVYTINDPIMMKDLIKNGVNGIITDAIYVLNEVKLSFHNDFYK